jgi:hypothetical protein
LLNLLNSLNLNSIIYISEAFFPATEPKKYFIYFFSFIPHGITVGNIYFSQLQQAKINNPSRNQKDLGAPDPPNCNFWPFFQFSKQKITAFL